MPQIPVLGGTQGEPLAEGGTRGRREDLKPSYLLCNNVPAQSGQNQGSKPHAVAQRRQAATVQLHFWLPSLPHPAVRSQEVISVGEAKLLRGRGDGKVRVEAVFLSEVSRSRGREKGGRRSREWLVFIFAREAHLMIFPQIDKQTRDGHTEHTCVFWNNPYPQIQDAACCHNHPANCPGYG